MALRTQAALAVAAAWLIGLGTAVAQPNIPPKGPLVSMQVASPGVPARDLTTHESGLATLDVNGHQYGFRPTMHDDAGAAITVTIFDMGSAAQPIRELAAVAVKGGGAEVASKSSPAFTVKAWKSMAPPSEAGMRQSTRQ